jgi:hypothetical protein
MDKLDALLAKLEDVRDDFRHQLDAIIADTTLPTSGEDRSRTIKMLNESIGSFTLALERFKP